MNPWAFITVLVFSFYAYGVYAKRPGGDPTPRVNMEPQDDVPDGSSVWDYSSKVNINNVPSRHPKRFSRRRQYRDLTPGRAPESDEVWVRGSKDFQLPVRPTGDAVLPDIDYAQRRPTDANQKLFELDAVTRQTLPQGSVQSREHSIRINGKTFSVMRNGDIVKNFNPTSMQAQNA